MKAINKVRLNSLTGIKGIGFLFVFAWHINSLLPKSLPHFGNVGVELFFVISGFLIAYNYYNTDRFADFRSGGGYVLNKICGLYPLHLVTFIAMAVLYWRSNTGDTITYDIFNSVVNAVLLQSWVPNTKVYFAFNGVAWYLCVILFAYFCTPLLFRLTKDNGKRACIYVILIFIIKTVIEICTKGFSYELHTWLIYACPITRTLDFFAGIQLFVIWKESRTWIETHKRVSNCIQLLLIVIFCAAVIWQYDPQLYAVIDCTTLLLVFALTINTKLSSILCENPITQWLGRYSTELYLIHLPVKNYICIIIEKMGLGNINFMIQIFIIMCISLACSYLWRICYSKLKVSFLNN